MVVFPVFAPEFLWDSCPPSKINLIRFLQPKFSPKSPIRLPRSPVKIFPTGSQMLRPSPAVMVFSQTVVILREIQRKCLKMQFHSSFQKSADGVQTLPMFSLNLMRREASSFWLRALFRVWISFRWVLPRALG